MKRIIAIAILAIGLAGCSATTEVTSPTVTTKPSVTTTTKPVAHVGATLGLTGEAGAKADVTLVQVIDPAQPGDQYTTPDAGKRFVSTLLKITNTGTAALTGDADGDSTLIGSDGQSYSSDFDNVAECTDFSNGEFQLGPNESATGCVTFQVPTGVMPAKFQYSPNSGFSGQFGEWLIP